MTLLVVFLLEGPFAGVPDGRTAGTGIDVAYRNGVPTVYADDRSVNEI